MNQASNFLLSDDRHNCQWSAPVSMAEQPETLTMQALEACSVLYELNRALCGQAIGPCRRMTVFNDGERDEDVVCGSITDCPTREIGGQG